MKYKIEKAAHGKTEIKVNRGGFWVYSYHARVRWKYTQNKWELQGSFSSESDAVDTMHRLKSRDNLWSGSAKSHTAA